MEKYVPYAALSLAILTFAFAHLRTKGSAEIDKRCSKLEDRLEPLLTAGDRLTRIETQLEIYFSTIEKKTARVLHRPTHEEMDNLLDKRTADKPLAREEARTLEEMLEDIIEDDSERVGFRTAAIQMLAARKARKVSIGD